MTDILCTCRRLLSSARKIGGASPDGVGQCPCGARWYRVDFAQHCDQVAAVNHWNRAMRTASSRRKFAISG